jgi:DNA-binding NarL/FixJ family response regulator
MPVKVAIVEDNLGVRTSWERIINAAPGYTCCCACATAEQAVKDTPAAAPDVVLMDIHLPNLSGIECTVRLREILPEARILMLTVYADSENIFKALQAGASGYLLKRTTPPELFEAIKQVMSGGAPMTGEVARKVIDSFRRPVRSDSRSEEFELTRREEEVLTQLAQGYSDKEIASRLHVSFDTVRTHLKHIYEKLHVRSRTEAALKFVDRGQVFTGAPVAKIPPR